jgi:hypothetical protein
MLGADGEYYGDRRVIIVVTALAATAEGVFPAAMTATRRRTRSAAQLR